MNTEERKVIQRRVGLTGDDVDGDIGPISLSRIKSYLRSLMPSPHPWPKTDYGSLVAFYGQPGDESNLTKIIPPFQMFYDGKPVNAITLHKKCAQSLLRVLTNIHQKHGTNKTIMAAVSNYAGCFNNRNKRGGTSKSLHAWGAATDLDPDNNGNNTHWPNVATMPFEVMEEFAREGWLPAGAFWSRDAMHFQATQ